MASTYHRFLRRQGRWGSQISCSGSARNSSAIGIFTTQDAAAEACDTGAIKLHEVNALTNFSHGDAGRVMESSTLLPEEDPHKVNETEMETGVTDASERNLIDFFIA